jgi:hypothetical protein
VKKLLTILFLAAITTAAIFAQDEEPSFKLSGEAKTGIFYQDSQKDGEEVKVEEVKLHSRDDAGGVGEQGRFRLNMDYNNGKNLGFRARFQWQNWNNNKDVLWEYAFGYGDFFNDTLAQMTVSVGKLGGSPWGTGGDMWKELEANGSGGGMRVEWKPAFPREYGSLNAGFVINYYNEARDSGTDNAQVKITLGEILRESVIGVSYTLDDWFMVRLAYRLDSDVDAVQNNKGLNDAGKGEDELVYRVEERALRNVVPGLRIWALGHLFGLSAINKEIQQFRNWFFVEYDPPELWGLSTPFTATLSVGNDTAIMDEGSLSEFFLKPSFYWHFFDKLVSLGTVYKISFDYGDGGIEGDHPYYYMELEPKIQLNFQSSYIAFAYQFRKKYIHDYQALPGREAVVQEQWMNLRFCIYF